MKAAALSYDELFAARERDQAVAALSDVAMLQRDLKRVRIRLRKSDRCLLDQDGWFIKIWDVFTLFALMFTVFVTPYEIGFLAPETTSIGLEVSNYLILFIFSVGIVVSSTRASPRPLLQLT